MVLDIDLPEPVENYSRKLGFLKRFSNFMRLSWLFLLKT